MRPLVESANRKDWPRLVSERVKALGKSITSLAARVTTNEAGIATNAADIVTLQSASPVAHSAMQLTNTDTATSINTASLTVVPMATATSFGSDFTQSGSAIQADFDGVVRLSASVHMTGSIVRSAVGLEYFQNTTSLGFHFNTSYMRSTGGHNETTTVCAAVLVSCSDGDTFDIRSVQEAVAGTVTMQSSGSSFLLVERVS